MAIRHMECCVCGEDAGRFEQHWNRDTGYGVCRRCVDWVRSCGETDAEILDLYGVEGVNYAAPEAPASVPYVETAYGHTSRATRSFRVF